MFSMSSFICTTWIIVMMVSIHMHGSSGCIESERKALLELNAYFNNTLRFYNLLNETNSDCCRWEGVKCDLTNRRVISLFFNTAVNDPPPLNLSLLHPFGELQILNLTSFWCPYWFDEIHGYKSLGRLTKLEVLDISWSFANNSVLPFISAASSLKTLDLRSNNLAGAFPMKGLKNLTNLQLLDLSDNQFSGPLLELKNLTNLQLLDLSENRFSGPLLGLCQLKNLLELDLSQNQFTGQIPKCLENLTQLRVIDISSNQFDGTIPSFMRNMDSIEYLSLSENKFDGLFSLKSIANLSKLKVFKLSSKSSLLQVETDVSVQPKFQLNVIQLHNCNLENVPSFLQHQKELRLINLSNNKITRSVPSWFLVQHPKLKVLLLQNNSFTNFQLSGRLLVHSLQALDVSANEFDGELPENFGNIFQNLKYSNLANNGFHGMLPSSFGEMNMLYSLDLSHNNLSGNIPREFLMVCNSLRFLKLSYNRFTGQVFSGPANMSSLEVLIADNNQFSTISDGLRRSNRLVAFDLSSNDLRGILPSWLDEFSLRCLILSNNLLEGTIPRTLFNNRSNEITLMDLSRNKFSGTLPTYFNCSLDCTLILNDNEFSGVIPSTLLENINVLDLRNNDLSGTIPHFNGTQSIQYLLLRGNRLRGYIPKDICHLNNIKILDLANNRLNGSIPSCLTNMSSGRIFDYMYTISHYMLGFELRSDIASHLELPPEFVPVYVSYFYFTFQFALKSRYESFNQRSYNFMSGLDLSNNELTGEIPKELGDLDKMRALNLSHNSLSGQIPKSFSNLTDMESIDLSYNMLHGPIPYDLTKLDSLVMFNVSYNNISGSIPSQGKFLTLDATNYIANPLLCGLPVNRSCDKDTSEPEIQSRDGETTIDMESFYWSLAATYSVTWIAFTVFLGFDTSWRQAWFRLVDAFINFFRWV